MLYQNETEEERKDRAVRIVDALERFDPDAVCALQYDGDPWRLLVMGRLSAQCTDARVNTVCEELFRVFPDCASMAAGDLTEIERIVAPCGIFRMKAANIRDFSRIITEKYDGRVPSSMEDLTSLPGVGRKIANLILGDVFGMPAIVTDTHCIRISNRLGLCDTKDPVKVEQELLPLIPPEKSAAFCHRLVRYGRSTCMARSPRCSDCILKAQGLCIGEQKSNDTQ